MEDQEPQKIDYQNPQQMRAPTSTAANFGFGVLIVIAAALAMFGVIAVTRNRDARIGGFAVFAWLAAVPIAALSISFSKRRPGLCPGMLTAYGVILLIACGLCFYVAAHV